MIKFGSIKKEHLVGAAIGVGTVAAGYYLYKKNQNKVDSFLRKQGINIKTSSEEHFLSSYYNGQGNIQNSTGGTYIHQNSIDENTKMMLIYKTV